MAGIDKTYTDNYQEYKKFKHWADKQVLTFFDGYSQCIGNWVWDYEESDFKNGEIPIMNTPVWLDAYLIQNCTIGFVADRMKEVYSSEMYEELKNIDLSMKPPKEYEQNRKIVISETKKTKFPLHSKPYNTKFWWLQCNDTNWWYNSKTKFWTGSDYYPNNTNTAHFTSIKAIVRHLKKQYLPKGLTFTISGGCVGERYLITVG